MRVFFGLELDAPTAVKIADWRDRQFAHTGRPVPAANFHITLAFVGELRETALEQLCLSVDDWLAGNSMRGNGFDLDQTGYWQKPGIYWLGPARWPQQLTQLSDKLAGLASRVGGKREKGNFQPHITLFRRCAEAPAAPAVIPHLTLTYTHFTLFESRQGKQGVSYHPRQHWDLHSPAQ